MMYLITCFKEICSEKEINWLLNVTTNANIYDLIMHQISHTI